MVECHWADRDKGLGVFLDDGRVAVTLPSEVYLSAAEAMRFGSAITEAAVVLLKRRVEELKRQQAGLR